MQDISTGDLIRELVKRGYRTFPASRVVEKYPDGWVVTATQLEVDNHFQLAKCQSRHAPSQTHKP